MRNVREDGPAAEKRPSRVVHGIGVSEGLSIGRVEKLVQELDVKEYRVDNVEAEIARAEEVFTQACTELEALLANPLAVQETLDILHAHIEILRDPALHGQIADQIRSSVCNAEFAVFQVMQSFEQMFAAMDDPYLRERSADIRDLKRRLLRLFSGTQSAATPEVPAQFPGSPGTPVILVAEDIGPSDLAGFDRTKLGGIVTALGGSSSHSAIIARAMGIPAVVGLGDAIATIEQNEVVALDGGTGAITIAPDPQQLDDLIQQQQRYLEDKNRLDRWKGSAAHTKDGTRIQVFANITSLDDLSQALDVGVDGIGLFRTEFLYMNRHVAPTEEEQFQTYREVLTRMDGKPAVIRTLDIGGDKPLTYLPIEEPNPFLGYRAIRLCLQEPELFETQLRALYRASSHGNLHIMFPMISTVEETTEALKIAEHVRQELQAKPVPVGMMVETPASVWMIPEFARYVDFFSIGSNDLIQYIMAADRTNKRVANLNSIYQPSVFRAIRQVIEEAHRAGKPVAMCGEMAGEVTMAPILLALGLDEFSMSPARVLAAKDAISQWSRGEAVDLLQSVAQAQTAGEVETILRERT